MLTRNLKNTKQMCVICKNKQEYILFDEIDFSYHSSVHFHNQNFFCFLKDNTYLYGKLGVKKNQVKDWLLTSKELPLNLLLRIGKRQIFDPCQITVKWVNRSKIQKSKNTYFLLDGE